MTASYRAVALCTALSALALAACDNSTTSTPAVGPTSSSSTTVLRQPGTPANLPVITIASTAFANGAVMPASVALAGCGGTNVSPNLSWSGAPATTQSYVLTEFDPDAPTGVGFWHWLLMNVPSSVTSLATGAGTGPPAGAVAGLNDFGTSGYGGPCPPVGDGAHRYIFTVSALDIPAIAGVGATTTGAFLTFSMRGHIIAQGTYVGLYSR